MQLKANNQFRNKILHNTKIPLNRIYKIEKKNNNSEKYASDIDKCFPEYYNDSIHYSGVSVLPLSPGYNKLTCAFIMSKNNFIDLFYSNLESRDDFLFNNKYTENYITNITNYDINDYEYNLYMNNKKLSKIKIPAYLTKKYIKDNRLILNKKYRYDYLNDSSGLIITDHRLYCMFLDFIPEYYKDNNYYVIYCDSLKNYDTLYLRTPKKTIIETIDNYPDKNINELPVGTIKEIKKYYDTFDEAVFDMKTSEIKNTKSVKIITNQANYKVYEQQELDPFTLEPIKIRLLRNETVHDIRKDPTYDDKYMKTFDYNRENYFK